jgi:hypothetical protein
MKKLSEYTAEEIQALEPELISMLLDKWNHVSATGKALEAVAKALISNGTKIPNWSLKDGSVRRKTEDAQSVAEAMMASEELNIKPSDLMGICSFSAKDLTDLIREKAGVSEKRAKELLREVLGSLLTETLDKPSLKREKKEQPPDD